MSNIRIKQDKSNSYVLLEKSIIQNNNLSFEARGIYAALQAGVSLDDIEKNMHLGNPIKELIEIGYLECSEVKK